MVNDKMLDGIVVLYLVVVNNCIEIVNILIKSVSSVLVYKKIWYRYEKNILGGI